MTKVKYIKLSNLILSLTLLNQLSYAAFNVAGNVQEEQQQGNNNRFQQQPPNFRPIQNEGNPVDGQGVPVSPPGQGQPPINQPRFNNEPAQNNFNPPSANYDYNSNVESMQPGNAPRALNTQNSVVLNFENADIRSVIRAISELSGKNFVVDPKVKGVINIISDKPVSKEESYKVLEAALRMQGYGTVESDGVIKVLPEQEAKTYGMQIDSSFKRAKIHHQLGDQIITKVFVIEHGSASQLANSLRPLIAPNNSISVYTNNNTIIITDYASNLRRISKIIDKLSAVEGGSNYTKPIIIALQNVVAADAVQIIQSYMGNSSSFGGFGGGQGFGGGGGQDGPSVQISVSPNTNSIILYSTNLTKLKEIRDLAYSIDKDLGSAKTDMHVVYLKNADAQHIAEVLRTIVTGQDNPDLTASSSASRFASEPSSSFGTSSSSGGSGGGTGGTGISSNQQKGGSSGGYRGGANSFQNGANQKDQPKILVQAEPSTNSLIIEAPLAVYKNLRMIIDMLDIRRAQVMIEAMIADISATQSGTLGVQWLAGAGSNNGGVLALGNYGQNGNQLSGLASAIAGTSQTGASSTAASGGINLPNEVYVGLVTGTTTVGGQQVPTIGALADMINANSVGNVLSRPTMITLDNDEVRLMVGSNIGIPNGSYQNTAAVAGNLVTTITRQDLGTVLQVKPLITQSGAIQLDIWQENSLLDPNQPLNASINGPSFLRRNLRATVLVDDGQIIALGGMSSDSITITQNGVPGLSQIPYIGWLFSWERRQHIKSNLVLFLRPVIIKNIEGYKTLTNQRYSYIVGQESLAQIKGSWGLPEIKPVTLDNQVPYNIHGPLPDQGNPSLNLNKNLPIVDLTKNGEAFNANEAKSAIKVDENVITANSASKTQ